MDKIIVTPQVFFEIFILCLSWQWNPEQYTTTWTTAHKVARILAGLGLLSESQKKMLHKDRRTQHLFLRNSVVIVPGFEFSGEDGMLSLPKPLVIVGDRVGGVDRARLLQDVRIHMTLSGKAFAETLEFKYTPHLNHKIYHDEVDRQEQQVPIRTKSMGAVMNNYRKKVLRRASSRED